MAEATRKHSRSDGRASRWTYTAQANARSRRPVGRPRFSLKIVYSRFPGLILLGALLWIWDAVTRFDLVEQAFLPSPAAVVSALINDLSQGDLLDSMVESIAHLFAGYALAGLIGISLGIAIGLNRTLYRTLEPLIELTRPVPVPALVPLLILYLGIEAKLKIAVVFVGTLFPILLNTYAGVSALPLTLKETAQTFGLTKWQTIREIVLPQSAPAILLGLRVSLAIGLIVTTVAELVAGTGGIGYFILRAEQGLHVSSIYAGILVLALTGYLLNVIMLRIERAVLHWRLLSSDSGY